MAAAPLAIYGLVVIQSRYVAAAMVLLLLASLAGARVSRARLPAHTILGITAAALIVQAVPIARAVIQHLTGEVVTLARGGTVVNAPWEIPRSLRGLGVRRGDALAIVGTRIDEPDGTIGFANGFPDWARIGGYRVVAVFPDALDYWTASEDGHARADQQLRAIGVKAIITPTIFRGGTRRWHPVGNGHFAHLLDESGGGADTPAGSTRAPPGAPR